MDLVFSLDYRANTRFQEPSKQAVARGDSVSSVPTRSGAHGGPEAAHRGPVQRPAPVPVPGGEAAAGEAEDGGAQGADPAGRAQGPAVRGDLPSAEGRPRDRGEAQGAGSVRSAAGEFGSCETS